MLAELEDQQKLDKAILAAGNPRFKEELWINHRMLQLFGLYYKTPSTLLHFDITE